MIRKYLLFLSIFLIGIKYSQQGSDEAKLHDYLFSCSENGTAYNPLMRPVKDPNQRIKVDVVVGIKRLFEMDEINHKVTLFAIFVKTWKDEFLKWDPKNFSNIEYTYVSYNKIWTPQLQLVSKFLTNEPSADYSIHDIYDNYPIKLWYNGSVQFTPSLHLNTECLFSYARFPFDYQLCSFRFQAPYSMRQIDFSFSSFYTKEYHKYDQIWQIEDAKWIPQASQERFPVNFLRVDFRRTVRNYLFTMPSYIVYMLTLLMFVLPQTSNQRILIGSTCLIIATLLAYTLTANLPHTDISAWPILGKMYLFNIVLLTFSLIFSTFIINISSRDHIKSVPDWLRRFTLNVLAKIFCMQAIAYTVFNSYSFKSQDDESVVVQEHIASQVVMSEIDPEVTIRDRNQSNINGGNYSSGGLIVGEDMAYEKLTSSRVETANNSLNSSLVQPEPSTIRPNRLNSDSSSKMTLTRLLKNIYDHMEQIRYRLQRDTYKRCVNNEWLLVGTLVDKILFFVYCSVVIFCTLSIFKN